nr:MAG TPA: hypothetical protein [Caudoviricetes sp.]
MNVLNIPQLSELSIVDRLFRNHPEGFKYSDYSGLCLLSHQFFENSKRCF